MSAGLSREERQAAAQPLVSSGTLPTEQHLIEDINASVTHSTALLPDYLKQLQHVIGVYLYLLILAFVCDSLVY
jgi:hypothetical protein